MRERPLKLLIGQGVDCVDRASSATSEHAFSKAKLIISKKRQWLMADHVNGTKLMGLEVAKLFLNLRKLGIL